MAGGRLVVMTNSESPIKGNCIADGTWKDQIKLLQVNLGVGATVDLDDKAEWTGHVSQSNVTVVLDDAGPWIAELQQALFSGINLGKVTITELSQSNNVYAKVRELVLADGWISGMSCTLSGTKTMVTCEVSYSTSTVNWGDKVAFFHPEGKYT
jgi:hypothetical protein